MTLDDNEIQDSLHQDGAFAVAVKCLGWRFYFVNTLTLYSNFHLILSFSIICGFLVLSISVIRRHLDDSIGYEKKFGPATALTRYGRELTVIPEAPHWLSLGASKECFRNAAHLMLQREDVDYAEGYAVDLVGLPLPIQHAWVVDKEGRVIDPTWSDSSNNLYFGVVFRKDFVSRMITMSSYWSGLLADPVLMRRHFGTPELLEGGLLEERSGGAMERSLLASVR